MIPPFVQQVLGVLLRAIIVWVAAKFGASLSESQVLALLAQIVPVVAVIVWSIWQKYVGRQKLLTALATSKMMTEKQVEEKVSLGGSPSVNTPKDVKP